MIPMTYLTTQPIAWDRITYLERSAIQHGCGALVTFVGIVRGDRYGGRIVQALYYAAYAEMAEQEIGRLVDEARIRWPLDVVQVQHRLGYVEAGHISVAVVVAAQHRAEAYAASQCLIEQIKHHAPIWKRELFDDGTSQWSMCTPETLCAADPAGAVHAHL